MHGCEYLREVQHMCVSAWASVGVSIGVCVWVWVNVPWLRVCLDACMLERTALTTSSKSDNVCARNVFAWCVHVCACVNVWYCEWKRTKKTILVDFLVAAVMLARLKAAVRAHRAHNFLNLNRTKKGKSEGRKKNYPPRKIESKIEDIMCARVWVCCDCVHLCVRNNQVRMKVYVIVQASSWLEQWEQCEYACVFEYVPFI